MAELDPIDESKQVNPYLLPASRQGWRGLSVHGNSKRKAWTLLHNDTVLVTALLLIPGERSIRHSHETGELSIHYLGELTPTVSWNPPGALHPSLPAPPATSDLAVLASEAAAKAGDNRELSRLLEALVEEHLQLGERLQDILRSRTAPFVIVDVLFPPFRTTIDDPAVPEKRTITGQWWD
jgi:hypothetical protein